MAKSKMDEMRAKMKKFTATAASSESGQEMKKAQSVIGYDSNYQEMDVPLAQVYRDPGQPRPTQDVLDGLPEFADKLEANNFVLAQLPLYYGFPDDTFQIIAGERRTEAFRLKGREFIKARVLKVPSKEIDQRKTLDLQWAENNDRKNLTIWGEADFFKRYIDSYYGGKVPEDQECMTRFGRSQRTIYTFLKLTKLDAPVKEFCKHLNIDSAKNAEIIQACFKRVGKEEFSKVTNDYLTTEEDDRLPIKVFFRPLSLNAVSKTEESTNDTGILNAVSKTEEDTTDTGILNAVSKTEEDTTDTGILNAVSKTEEGTTDTRNLNAVSKTEEGTTDTRNLNAVSKTEEGTTSTRNLNAVSKTEENATITGLDSTIKDVLLPLSGAIKKGINKVDKDFKLMSQRQGDHDLKGIIKALKEMKADISNLLDYINDYQKGAK